MPPTLIESSHWLWFLDLIRFIISLSEVRIVPFDTSPYESSLYLNDLGYNILQCREQTQVQQGERIILMLLLPKYLKGKLMRVHPRFCAMFFFSLIYAQ